MESELEELALKHEDKLNEEREKSESEISYLKTTISDYKTTMDEFDEYASKLIEQIGIRDHKISE